MPYKKKIITLTLTFLLVIPFAVESVVGQPVWGCYKFAYFYGKKDPAMREYWMGMGLASTDINRDGHLDLLCSAHGPKTVFVYFGGPALFDTTVDLTIRGGAEMAIADFDGDGLQDLAVHLRMYTDSAHTIYPDSVLIYPGVADGPYAIDTIPRYVIAIPISATWPWEGSGYMGEDLFRGGDVDGDGRDELIMGSIHSGVWDYGKGAGGVCIWRGPVGGRPDSLTYIRTSNASIGATLRSIESGDVNGDGITDLVLATIENNEAGKPLPHRVRVAFGSPGRYPDPSRPDQFFENDVMGYANDTYINRQSSFWVTLLDVNRDGIDDLLWVPCRDSLLIMYGGEGGLSGRIDRVITNPDTEDWAGFTWRHHRIGDYNGDGYDDYVIGMGAGGFHAEMLFLGNAEGLTNQARAVCVGSSAYSGRYVVNVGDLDGDDDEEYLASDPIPPQPQDLPYQEGFALIVEGQSWMVLGVEYSHAVPPAASEPFTVEVFPVPGSGDFSILIRTDDPGEYTVTIYSIEGRQLYERRHTLLQADNVLPIRAQDLPVLALPSMMLIDVGRGTVHVQQKYLRE
ncbi:MAG: VCBS repeat-containing protein [Bacteroidetes bacterium]|nr:VCBS repeat-containing protein [Bacteroidota bacterium]